MARHFSGLLRGAAVILTFSPSVRAEDGIATELPRTVVTATRTPLRLDQSLSTASLIGRDELAAAQSADVADVLRFQAGNLASWNGSTLRFNDQFQGGPNLVRGFRQNGFANGLAHAGVFVFVFGKASLPVHGDRPVARGYVDDIAVIAVVGSQQRVETFEWGQKALSQIAVRHCGLEPAHQFGSDGSVVPADESSCVILR